MDSGIYFSRKSKISGSSLSVSNLKFFPSGNTSIAAIKGEVLEINGNVHFRCAKTIVVKTRVTGTDKKSWTFGNYAGDQNHTHRSWEHLVVPLVAIMKTKRKVSVTTQLIESVWQGTKRAAREQRLLATASIYLPRTRRANYETFSSYSSSVFWFAAVQRNL